MVIVARGGGSLADLFAFCDETLCRTVALLPVPVISSVGHHTDRTLIDDVAALACSTPTHAAEAAVPVDCIAARRALADQARRLQAHGRRAIVDPRPHAASPGPRAPAPRRAASAAACTSCCASCGPARAAGTDQRRRAGRHPAARPAAQPAARRRAPRPPRAGASSSGSRSPWPRTIPPGRCSAATRWSPTAPAPRWAAAAEARVAGTLDPALP